MNIIFDFDGVVLNSNHVKTEGFASLSKEFGIEASQNLVRYHLENGGISRFNKIEWFVNNELKRNDKQLIEELIFKYGKIVEKKLLECKLRTNLYDLKQKLSPCKWYIASGGLETEIIKLMNRKNLSKLFDGGIYGSPKTKQKIIKDLKKNFDPLNKEDWVLIGDSKYDYYCALENDVSFIFAYEWTDIVEYRKFISENNLKIIKGIEDLTKELLK
tara:strand:- start:1172 stop:1819 length:648 start_codon:yes stop_codon:yes gene_type:complete